ncbi:MAG TPA: chorismate mutase [Clostridiales bacterium]|nr:chorismate mutase [Clostridiales bacterium]
MKSIRGAITCDKNCKTDILSNATQLLNAIISANKLSKDEIICIFFSCTSDLDKVYPAVAARQLGFTDIGLMCFQEMQVENSLKMCIRVMLLVNQKNQRDVVHVYLKGAEKLRPDLKLSNFLQNERD